MNTKQFIEKAREIHGDKYDYSKVEFLKAKTKVCIICPEHGEFWQTPQHHLEGHGCSKCGNKAASEKQKFTVEQFVEKAREIHGDKYDYSKVEYKDSHTRVCIICPIHGEFWQLPYDHLNGKGCNKCGYKSLSRIKTKTTEEFIKKSREIHGDKYDYSKVEYKGCFNKVCIICSKHGEFWQRPTDHINGKGCPVCRESKMELLVESILLKNNITFERQKRFNWLGSQSLDFYLPKYHIAVECQGIQHYKPVSFGSKKHDKYEMLSLIKERDDTKRMLCQKNNINILYFSTEVCANTIIKNENDLLKEIDKYDL